MKIKLSFLTVLLLTVVSVSFAQQKKPAVAAAAIAAPDVVVKNLYEAHKSPKTDPFFQNKNRTAVDKFFVKEFADLIWEDNNHADGEVGTIDFDPLHGGQDNKITAFKIGRPLFGEGNSDVADVPVNFRNYGKAFTVLYRLERGANKTWKISNISYVTDNFNLRGALLGEETATGRLNLGKNDSAIVSVGAETGDYAARCFANDSEVGKQILAICQNGDECEVVIAKTDFESRCKVEGLEANLSSSGKIVSVKSVRKLKAKK